MLIRLNVAERVKELKEGIATWIRAKVPALGLKEPQHQTLVQLCQQKDVNIILVLC